MMEKLNDKSIDFAIRAAQAMPVVVLTAVIEPYVHIVAGTSAVQTLLAGGPVALVKIVKDSKYPVELSTPFAIMVYITLNWDVNYLANALVHVECTKTDIVTYPSLTLSPGGYLNITGGDYYVNNLTYTLLSELGYPSPTPSIPIMVGFVFVWPNGLAGAPKAAGSPAPQYGDYRLYIVVSGRYVT